MEERKWKILLIGVIIVSLVAAGYVAWQRHALENQHRSVGIAVVYDEIDSLARMNDVSTAEVLDDFRDRGVSTVLIKESTLSDAELNGELSVRTGSDLLMLDDTGVIQKFGSEFRKQIKSNYWYIMIADENVYHRVKGHLEVKKVQVRTWEQPGGYIIEAGYSWKLLQELGLGFSKAAVEEIQKAGLKAIVQVRTWNQVTTQGLTYVFEEIAKIPNLSGIAFNDPMLPGYPDQIRALYYSIKPLGVPVVQIEFSNQMGFTKLGILLDKHVLRLHTLTLGEDAKKNYKLAEIVDRFALAATERNNRVLLVHTYMKTGVPDMRQMNLELVEEIHERLLEEGMQVGEPSVLQSLDVSRGIMFFIGLGIIAGGMLLLFTMGWGKIAPYMGLLGLLLWIALLAVDMVNPARKLMAFAAVVVFPTLSIALNVKRDGSSVYKSILILIRTSLYSLVGAILMVGLLADIGFMLKLNQFTGVKLAHLVPLLLLAMIFFFKGAEVGLGWQRQLKRFWEQPVLVKFAAVGGVLLVALLVYVSRTGNESVAISSFELKFRTLLDNLLMVRPRTKEFLFGYPLMLLLIYLGYRDNRYMPLLLGGAIGQISLVNTYAHIHTPLAVSLLRSFNGLWLGIVGGLVLIALWRVGEKLVEKYYQP